jgi:hypothetical protein
VEHYRVRPTFRQVQGDQSAIDVSKDIAAAVESVIGART